MRVWIDILHIPQFNFYKPFINQLLDNGHQVIVTVLNRGKLPVIAKKELTESSNLSIYVIGRHRMNKFSVIFEANLLRILRLFFWTFNKKIDIAFSNGSHVGMMGTLFGFSTYEFEDDPQAADYELMVKFSTQNHSMLYELPPDFQLNPKDKLLQVLKEWAYLSPLQFKPDKSSLLSYNVHPHSYLFAREVSVGTLNYSDQTPDSILKISSLIPKDMPVLLSLEKKEKRAEYPENWILLQEPIEDIHSLIYYSAGLVSSGDSMAREAALLGVPSYYLGIRYTMPANAAASKVANLQNQQTMPFDEWIHTIGEDPIVAEQRQNELRKQIDDKFIDINKFMMDLVLDVERKKQNK